MYARLNPTIFPTHAGRVAVVTGAGQGLGQSFSQHLAQRGAVVVGVDLIGLEETAAIVEAAGSTFLGITASVSDQDQVTAMATKVESELGRCDILINNAAIYDPVTWDDLDFDRWRAVMSVDLDGPFLMAKALVPLMTKNNYGRIVNIVSTTFNQAMPIYFAYRSSKMGLVGLTRALASLGDRGITANCVSPSLTRTPGTDEANSDHPEWYDMIRERQSIKLDAIPADLAHSVMFLTSEESYWVSGQAIPIDGGLFFGMP